MKSKFLIVTLVTIFSLALVSYLPTDAANVKKIKLNRKSITLKVGEKTTLNITTKIKAKWKSSDRKIATVTAKGIVKAKKAGKARIIAYKKNQKAVCNVIVNTKRENQLIEKPTPTPIPNNGISTSVPVDTPLPLTENDKISFVVNQDSSNTKKLILTVFNGSTESISFAYTPLLKREENGVWTNIPYKVENGLPVVGDPLAVLVKSNEEWARDILLDDYFDNLISGKYMIEMTELHLNAIFSISLSNNQTEPLVPIETDKILLTVQQDRENIKKIKFTVFNGTNDVISFNVIPLLEKEENGVWTNIPYKVENGLPVVGDPLAVLVKANEEWSNEILLNNYFNNVSSGKYRIKLDGLLTDLSSSFLIT